MSQDQATGPETTTIKGRGSVQAGGAVAAQPGAEDKVRKVIVAVHGVGDQYNFATIQAVVNQFCRFHGQPAAVPLGRFHSEPRFSISPPFPEGTFDHLAFAEVYWAKVPREVVGDAHTIEEAKKWAGTLVERLRLDSHLAGGKMAYADADYDRIRLVVEEMIQTLAVLERLSFLAAQAGLFTFDLKKLLENYLGDVQIVAEFDTSRTTILAAFRKTMEEVSAKFPRAEIHIIAHSEGTVVSLLGLLQAGRTQPPPAWLGRVRGFMTLGSPIDKHLILWPTLFGKDAPASGYECKPRIEWRNYYDRGDPIGFDLDLIREWLKAHRWDKVFTFSDDDDFGFVRYPFPGKAHVDYWTDPEVFGHFIEHVVKETPVPPGPPRKPPATLRWKKVLSYVVPYVLVIGLIVTGLYVLYRAVIGAARAEEAMTFWGAVCLVTAATLMVLGVTIAVRVPRLTSSITARVVGALVAFDLLLLALLVGERIGPGLYFITQVSNARYLIGAVVVIIVALVASARWPSQGPKVLIACGTIAMAAFVINGLNTPPPQLAVDTPPPQHSGPIGPVVVALAVFLYLWWLAALLLDLVLVWHFLVHSARRVRNNLAAMAGEPVGPS
jgi:hypothetical protein